MRRVSKNELILFDLVVQKYPYLPKLAIVRVISLHLFFERIKHFKVANTR